MADMRLDCPDCGANAMGPLRKLAVGPARAVACDACGARLSTPWWSVITVAPMLAAIAWLGVAWADPTRWIAVLAAFAVSCLLHLDLVPLVRRDR
jgi:hypothetical protein